MNSTETRPVIVPLDGSARSAAILPVVRTVLELFGAPAYVVSTDPENPDLARLRQRLPALDRLRIGGWRECSGNPAEAVRRAAEEENSRGVVMALDADAERDSEAAAFERAVLHRSRWPVLLIPHQRLPPDWQLRRVVLPHDGSPETGRAIRPSIRIAERARATLLVLHVAGTEPSREPGTLAAPQYVDQPQHEWPAWAEEFLGRAAALCGAPVTVPMEMFVASGETGPAVLRFTREHAGDLLFLPWHCDLSPDHATTLRAIIRDAPCPLVMLPADSADDTR